LPKTFTSISGNVGYAKLSANLNAHDDNDDDDDCHDVV